MFCTPSRAAVSQDDRAAPLEADFGKRRRHSLDVDVGADQAITFLADQVDRSHARPDGVQPVEQADHGQLVWDRDVGARVAGSSQASDQPWQLRRRDVPELVPPSLQPRRFERGRMHRWACRVSDSLAYEAG